MLKKKKQTTKTNLWWRLRNSSVNKRLACHASLMTYVGPQDPQRTQAMVVCVHLEPWCWGDRDNGILIQLLPLTIQTTQPNQWWGIAPKKQHPAFTSGPHICGYLRTSACPLTCTWEGELGRVDILGGTGAVQIKAQFQHLTLHKYHLQNLRSLTRKVQIITVHVSRSGCADCMSTSCPILNTALSNFLVERIVLQWNITRNLQ